MKKKLTKTAKLALALFLAVNISAIVIFVEFLVVIFGLFGMALGAILGGLFGLFLPIGSEMGQRFGAVVGLVVIVLLITWLVFMDLLQFAFGNERQSLIVLIILQVFGIAVGIWIGEPGGIIAMINNALYGALIVGMIGAYTMSSAVKYVLRPNFRDRFGQELKQTYLGFFNRMHKFHLDRLLPDAMSRKAYQIKLEYETEIEKIKRAVWVLESDFTQGTAFYLQGVGLITCDHVLAPNTYAFKTDNLTCKYPVTIKKSDKHIDLAIISIEAAFDPGLTKGVSDKLEQMDNLMVIGFPNYHWGDTVNITTGIVSSFRTVSGIRRILTDAPIVAGASGGPVLDTSYRVIGVAVTGADRIEDASITEYHGVVPIETLKFLSDT